MLREVEIRSTEDLILAREAIRDLARMAGCDPVIETRLVAGLSELAERFYRDACGRIVIRQEESLLEASLEHCLEQGAIVPLPSGELAGEAPQDLGVLDPEGILLAIGGVRYMWDEVDVWPAASPVSQGLKVVLRSWLK